MKYALEAMAIIQLPGLMIIDTVNGVPIKASVSTIAPNLFGFEGSDGGSGPSIGDIYYRDVLVLALAFVLGFFAFLTSIVFWRMRELR